MTTTRIISRKNRAFSLVMAAGLLALTGCANGPDAPTRLIRQVTDGVEATAGDIYIRNVVLVAQDDGSATLIGTFINEGDTPDSLTSISSGNTLLTLGAKTVLALLKNEPVRFGGDTANAAGYFPGLNATAGTRVPVTITFEKAGSVVLDVLVVARDGIYANVTN